MRHFYHLYCGPGAQWQRVASEHVETLLASGAQWETTVGIID